ncbi:MAG: tetratricopeptide repeat protein [Deltaproteobacteria bacterium]|nr:tetratricopeptide repeat protein [Deltaproteobacteria bacterium]
MASLKVICPKCLKGQQVVVDIPPEGLDHVCVLCKTSFRIRPPARSSSDDLPAPREAVPRPSDLPAPREAVPHPLDLPAPREAIPHPGDLPAPRETVPRPEDLPIDRNAVPRPGDLPVDRHAVPRPGDLPIDRDAVPRPGDLPVDRLALGQPSGPPALSFPPPRERPATKTPPLGLSLDLPPPPEPPAGSPSLTLGDPLAEAPRPGSLNLGPPPVPPAPAKMPPPLPRSPSRFETKPIESKRPASPAPKPPAAPTGIDATLPSLFSVGPAPAGAPPPVPPPPAAKPSPPSKPILAPLVPEPTEPPPSDAPAASGLAAAAPPRPAGAAPDAAKDSLDLGFSLEFESSPRTSSGSSPVAIPFPSARVASEGMADAAAEHMGEVPLLAPPSVRTATAGRALRPIAKKSGFPRWVFFAGGGVLVAAAGAAVAMVLLRAAPNPDNVLKPFLPELAKDNLAAYQNAAGELTKIAAEYKESGAHLRLKAAELLLLAHAAHGGAPNDVTAGEQAAAAAAEQPKLAAARSRVRALVAIANNKPSEADKLLADRAAPESQLVLGLARLREDNLAAAVTPLRAFVGARPDDMLGHYLLGRALGKGPEARKQFDLVLAKNPAHGGAQIGLAGSEQTPEKRLAAAQALVDKKLAGAGPAELASLHLLVGQSHLALGRTPEAIDAFQKAIARDKRFTPAYLALGEALLYDGKYAQALERLRAAGPTLSAKPEGKFALGGALIATGDAKRGLGLVGAAAKLRPDDPRGPFWTAVAAASSQPPDLAAGEQGYREALKKDPKFLPSSLKLAALLQQQEKAQDSLAVLRAAEEAGAPPPVLQLAWGDALIVAGEPGKAQEVFERALDGNPKSVAARLGIAAALQAQDKLEEAKVSLERTLKDFPETLGLRERLAEVCLRLGQKAEALAHYQAEIQAGHPSVPIRLAVARLALDMDKVALAQSEVKKVFDQSPRNAEAAYYMARIHESRGENGQALTEYRRATSWGNTPPYALAYGKLLDKLGKQNEALASLANAVSLAEGRMARGRIYFRAGDMESALADFQAAAKMLPKDAEPLVLQGLCHDKQGDAKKADASWRAALKIDPDAPEPHYRLGRTEMDRAKPKTAIEHFRKAMAKAPEKTPWLPDLHFQLAQAELLTGAKSAALASFKKYLEIAPARAPARPEAAQQVTRLGGRSSGEREKFGNENLRRKR